MEPTRIIWSDLTGAVGQEAMEQQADVQDVRIMGGITHDPHSLAEVNPGGVLKLYWYRYDWLTTAMRRTERFPDDYDVVVDFSDADVFDNVLDLAIAYRMPLICGTEDLSPAQMDRLLEATKIIKIFRGGLKSRAGNCHELARDVLKIAKVMVDKNKPVRPGEFYSLDEIRDELAC